LSLDAAADSPPSFGCARAVRAGKSIKGSNEGRLADDIAASGHLTVGQSSRGINQDRSSGVSETSPNRPKPVDFMFF
jgi:hypothetical protein